MAETDDIAAALASAPRVRAATATVEDGQIVGYVVAAPDTEATGAWRDVFRTIYEAPPADDGLDVRGWMSSIDGAPIPPDEMRQWRDATVALLRREPVGRVLEIGCGNGLLATELVPDCVTYDGTDLVADGFDEVRRRLDAIRPGVATLHHGAAIDLDGLSGPYDMVVLNSVIQYFPDAPYLLDVLDAAVARLAPGGRLFVGDVRHAGLADRLYTERAHARLAEATPARVDRIVRVNRDTEGELLVDPAFFPAVAARFGPDWVADVEPKRGRYDNELSRYRFDVTLRRGDGMAGVPHEVAYGDLADTLAAGVSPVLVVDVPNARLDPAGVHPDDFDALAAAHRYDCRLDWTAGRSDGAFDAYLSRAGRAANRPVPRPVGGLHALVRPPRRGTAEERWVDGVRAHAAATLPPDRQPVRIVVVDALPG